MQYDKSEKQMLMVIQKYIEHKKNIRVKIALPNTPRQHLLLVKAYEHSIKNM